MLYHADRASGEGSYDYGYVGATLVRVCGWIWPLPLWLTAGLTDDCNPQSNI